jgi:multidrug resistance efflux pump
MRATLNVDHLERALQDLESAIQTSQVSLELAERIHPSAHVENAAASLDHASVALARVLHLIFGPS